MDTVLVQFIPTNAYLPATEIHDLLSAAGYTTVDTITFEGEYPHPRHYIPETKLDQLKELIRTHQVKKVVIDGTVTPNQTFRLEDELDCEIIDKPMLILEIFENKANTKEIQLQVKLAQLKYAAPRMVKRASEGVRSERPGFGGSGEQLTELLTSDLQGRIARLERQLQQIKEKQGRPAYEFPQLPILGYYSAGKTTLFNILVDAQRDTGAEAFTTMLLKTSSTRITGYRIDLIDTMGLVGLPKDIINAFDLMLTSIFSYQALVLCLDASLDIDQIKDQLEHIEEYYHQFSHLTQKQILVVLTKVDLANLDKLKQVELILKETSWLVEYQVINCTNTDVTACRMAFITAIETLLSEELTSFSYTSVSPAIASKFHDIARIDTQSWNTDGTTTIAGIGPKPLVQMLKGVFKL